MLRDRAQNQQVGRFRHGVAQRAGQRANCVISNRLPRFRIRAHSARVCQRSQLFLKTGFRFLRAGPGWDLSEAAVRRSWSFRPNYYLSFSANYCFSVISFSPPQGMSEQKNSFTLSVQSQTFVGAGSGIRLSATIPQCLRTCPGNSCSGAYGSDANRLTKIPKRRARQERQPTEEPKNRDPRNREPASVG